MPKLCCVVLTALIAWVGGQRVAAASGTGADAPHARATRPHARATRPHVVFLGSANNPPFLWADESGTPHGFTVEFMHALAR